MKIALLGKGKTGSKLCDLLASDPAADLSIFDRQNPPTSKKLLHCDIIISFLPGEPFLNYIPLLLETNIPVITGSTGFTWPENLQEKLIHSEQTWVWGHNFSIGMNLVKSCLEVLGKAKQIFPESEYEIHEVHHKHKKDAPSGTALSFQNWLGQDAKITSERRGDVIGTHQLTLKTNFETIKLEHQALDRKLFANGALFAAKYLLKNKNLPKGLLNFSTMMEQALKNELQKDY